MKSLESLAWGKKPLFILTMLAAIFFGAGCNDRSHKRDISALGDSIVKGDTEVGVIAKEGVELRADANGNLPWVILNPPTGSGLKPLAAKFDYLNFKNTKKPKIDVWVGTDKQTIEFREKVPGGDVYVGALKVGATNFNIQVYRAKDIADSYMFIDLNGNKNIGTDGLDVVISENIAVEKDGMFAILHYVSKDNQLIPKIDLYTNKGKDANGKLVIEDVDGNPQTLDITDSIAQLDIGNSETRSIKLYGEKIVPDINGDDRNGEGFTQETPSQRIVHNEKQMKNKGLSVDDILKLEHNEGNTTQLGNPMIPLSYRVIKIDEKTQNKWYEITLMDDNGYEEIVTLKNENAINIMQLYGQLQVGNAIYCLRLNENKQAVADLNPLADSTNNPYGNIGSGSAFNDSNAKVITSEREGAVAGDYVEIRNKGKASTTIYVAGVSKNSAKIAVSGSEDNPIEVKSGETVSYINRQIEIRNGKVYVDIDGQGWIEKNFWDTEVSGQN